MRRNAEYPPVSARGQNKTPQRTPFVDPCKHPDLSHVPSALCPFRHPCPDNDGSNETAIISTIEPCPHSCDSPSAGATSSPFFGTFFFGKILFGKLFSGAFFGPEFFGIFFFIGTFFCGMLFFGNFSFGFFFGNVFFCATFFGT